MICDLSLPINGDFVTIMDRDKSYRDSSLIHYFLQVTFGDSPVINADIEANITVRMNNGSVVRVNNLTLLDNGYGGECQSAIPDLDLDCQLSTEPASQPPD